MEDKSLSLSFEKDIDIDEQSLLPDLGDNFSLDDFLDAPEKIEEVQDVKFEASVVEETSDVPEKTEEEILREHADGRIFTGRQAQQIGLIDSIGDLDTAEEQITKMAQEKHNNNYSVDLIQYAQKNIFSDYFVNFSDYGAKSTLSLEKMIPTSVKYSKRPLYLWE